MKENYIYPVKLKKEGDIILVTFPDFPDQVTEAETEIEAVENAQNVIALEIMDNIDQNKRNPEPSEQNDIILEDGEKLIYVQIWLPYYRQTVKEIYVKKTLTIPQWLDLMAKEKEINFSAVLVRGLKKELGIER